MKLITRILAAIMLLIVGALGFIYLSPDYNMYFVKSESMVPVFNMGDLVITGPLGGPLTPRIEPGTIITYTIARGEVTHRVIEINKDMNLITKGDNSEDPDQAPVNITQIKGIYLFKVPYFGYLTSFVRTKTGWYVSIILPAMLLVALIIKDIVKEALKSEN
ncbi:MAG: signal peptidase I [Dehalococcoidales bacterium]|nr:signal peptidase I [Dehalococcoidales bacterium]